MVGIVSLQPTATHADDLSSCGNTTTACSSPSGTPTSSDSSSTNASTDTNATQTATTGDSTVSNTPDGSTPNTTGTVGSPTDTSSDANQPADNSNSSNNSCPTQTQDPSSNDPNAGTQQTTDNNNNCITNNDNANSQSGSATVDNSGSNANATSGPSTDILNLLNEIASSVGGPGTQTFTDNIGGNTNGNIVIDPATLAALCGELQNSDNSNLTSNNNSTINNNVNLNANSGNATVENSGSGGTATTGNAEAIANLINIINSMVTDNQSFIGTINIDGNLNGNILLPQQLVNALLNQATATNSPVSLNQNSDLAINNNVNLGATSGNASVINSGSNGSATSGNASTNLALYNLVNDQIVATNALLVIINVEGSWQGVLLNSPSGTSIALLTGGLSSLSSIVPANITSNTNETINNNVNIFSTSGNALVKDSCGYGTATSGNAVASANIVNFLGDQIDLSGWFGILTINVFGNWDGSLLTVANSVPTSTPTDPSSVPPVTQNGSDIIASAYIYPAPTEQRNSSSVVTTSAVTTISSAPNTGEGKYFANTSAPVSRSSVNWWLVVIGFGLATSIVLVERALEYLKSSK